MTKSNIELKNRFHTIQIIEMNDFKNRKFNRLDFKDLITKISFLPFLTHFIFQNNGIDDTYSEELANLISKTKVSHLDLSRNEIGPIANKSIVLALKPSNKMQWLEYYFAN